MFPRPEIVEHREKKALQRVEAEAVGGREGQILRLEANKPPHLHNREFSLPLFLPIIYAMKCSRLSRPCPRERESKRFTHRGVFDNFECAFSYRVSILVSNKHLTFLIALRFYFQGFLQRGCFHPWLGLRHRDGGSGRLGIECRAAWGSGTSYTLSCHSKGALRRLKVLQTCLTA